MVVSSKQAALADHWDAIVIGSGIGGLATAALLAKHAGKRVLVLERHYTMGGFTHAFRRPGWEWDVGVHYIGHVEGKSGLGPIFADVTEGRLTWQKMPDAYDEVHVGQDRYELRAGREAFVDTLAQRFAGEAETIRSYLRLLSEANRDITAFFFERALPRRTASLTSLLLARKGRRWFDQTVDEVLRPRIQNPRLYDVLTAQWGDYGLPPSRASFAMHAMVARHYLHGGYYPVGGAAAIAESIEPVITRAGGCIAVRGEVKEIVIDAGRAVGVRMEDGRVLSAPQIVSDAGARNTWLSLVPQRDAERTGLPARIRSVEPSVGHLCLHLGLRGTAEELGLTGTNLWLYPEGDRDAGIEAFRSDPEHAPFPVVYASFPSAKDPTWSARYPGKSTIEVIAPAWPGTFDAYKDARWHKRGAEYDALKARFSERLLSALEQHRPNLRPHIAHSELSTPLSTIHFTGHPHGEMYGLSHGPDRFRLPLRAATPIDGLYFTGQDLTSCGVGGALLGGVLAAAAMMTRQPRALLDALRGLRG